MTDYVAIRYDITELSRIYCTLTLPHLKLTLRTQDLYTDKIKLPKYDN
jgi:hypothetical protein